jgi:hypothetical protein
VQAFICPFLLFLLIKMETPYTGAVAHDPIGPAHLSINKCGRSWKRGGFWTVAEAAVAEDGGESWLPSPHPAVMAVHHTQVMVQIVGVGGSCGDDELQL